MRLWSLGKRHGYRTQVQFFRDRWESDGVGLSLFVVLVFLLVPYLLIGIKGGGLTLAQITDGRVPEWIGSLAVGGVVMAYVTYGGLRGTAWANTFQTLVFMTLGAVAFVWIVRDLGGFGAAMDRVAAERPDLLVRSGRITPVQQLSYTCIPLSVGMFPHIFMHWLTARRAETFRVAIVAYPLCVAAVWVPSVLLGVIGSVDDPGLAGPAASSILVRLIRDHAPELLAGLLGAGVFAAIMSSLDSQVLSLGTMFTEDVVRRYGLLERMDERVQVRVGRTFVAAILLVTYAISLVVPPRIFSLGVWSFTGFAALFPVVLAAVFWKRSTRAGAIATVLGVAGMWVYFFLKGWNDPAYTVAGSGLMPVAVMLVAAALTMVVVSLATRPPDDETLRRFFGPAR